MILGLLVVMDDIVDFLVFCNVRDHFYREVLSILVHISDNILNGDADWTL